MRIYIASSWANKEAVNQAAYKLDQAGHRTTQTWPFEPVTANSRDNAIRDCEQIQEADCVMVLNDVQSVTGGMHFETGYGYAEKKWIVIIGPVTSIFHDLPGVTHYDTVDDFIKGSFNGGKYDTKRA